MRSSRNRLSRFGIACLAAVSLAYPVLFYVTRETIPPLAFVAAGLVILLLRLATSRAPATRLWRVPVAAAAMALAGLALLDQGFAARAYPVVLSLCVGAAFGISLRYPPSLVERLARLREPDLPPEGQAYCRSVTMVWTVWLVTNAAIATCLALWGSDEAWALWVGLVSYIVMALLIGGELLLRRRVRLAA